jgi:predicted nucleic acid-binding protein
VTVIDTSGVVDFLLGVGAAEQVGELMMAEGELAAPDLLVFEVVAVLRREALGGAIAEQRAAAAVGDLGDLPIDLFPSLPLRARAWSLRRNLTVADAIFAALAERLGEPLATKDAPLLAALERHTGVPALALTDGS